MKNTALIKNTARFLFLWISIALPVPIFANPVQTPPESGAFLTILATADLQGRFIPASLSREFGTDAGGIARLAYRIHQIRKDPKRYVLLISSGDDFMGRFFQTFGGAGTIDIMNHIGYNIMALGNHEFDRGVSVLSKALSKARFQVLCGNLTCDDPEFKKYCRDFVVQTIHGLKIGFFSLMTENITQVTNVPVRTEQSNLDAAEKYVDRLRDRCDLIVAVTHIGVEADMELARKVSGIDIIVGGHSHRFLKTPIRIGKTWIINGGERGLCLPCLDIPITENRKADLQNAEYSLIKINSNDPIDRELDDLVSDYYRRLPESTILGKTTVKWDTRKKALRYGESPIADLITDLIRSRFGVDIVFHNAGAIRGQALREPGPISDNFLSDLDEFRNEIVLVDLKGKYIKPILERSAAAIGTGGWLHVSGLRLKIDIGSECQSITSDGEPAAGSVVEKGHRVKSVQVLDKGGWVAVDPEKTYRIAVNRFLFDRAGDGYFWFKRYGVNPQYTMMTIYELLVSKLSEKGILNPPPPDGRVIVEGLSY